MKTLFIMRHAKSSWDDSSLNDYDRPLNHRGNRDAPAMGRYLSGLELLPDRVISSPAERAKQTIFHVAKQIGYPREKIQWDRDLYFGSAGAYLKAMHDLPDTEDSVLIAGHNPSVEHVISHLSGGEAPGRITTANIACFTSDATNWKHTEPKDFTFKWLMRPKDLQ